MNHLDYSYGFSGSVPSEASGMMTAAPAMFSPIFDVLSNLDQNNIYNNPNHCYFVPEFCLPSLNVLAVSDLHLDDLVDFINFLIRQELFHHKSLLSVTVLVAV